MPEIFALPVELVSAAKVKTCIWISPNDVKAPGTKPAIYSEHGLSGAWEFTDGTDDTLGSSFRLPDDMDRTVAPEFKLAWCTTTAVITETCVWQVEYVYTAAGEDTTAAAQETLTVNSNASATAHGLVIATLTGVDLPSATDVWTHVRIKRLGADPADDLTDDADFHGFCYSYTANKLGAPV